MLRLSSLAALALVLGACGPASTGTVAALPGATPGSTVLAAGLGEINSVISPEAVDVTIVWRITETLGDGSQRVSLERLQADGLGRFGLALEGIEDPGTGLMGAPDTTSQILAQSQAGYRVRYRAPHFYEESAIYLNYGVFKEEQTVDVAGVTCHRIHFESLYGRGNTVMLVDASNDVLVGWEYYDADNNLEIAVEPTSVEYNADHSGAVWVNATTNRRTYMGAADQSLLGFTPRSTTYLPQGYQLMSEHVLELEPDLNNILLRVYSDGLHMLFIAQQGEDPDLHTVPQIGGSGQPTPQGSGVATQDVTGLRQVQHVVVGQMRLIEGTRDGVRIFALGGLSYDDLLTVFGSVR